MKKMIIFSLSSLILAGCSQVHINQCSSSCTDGAIQNREQVECMKMCLDYKNKKNVTSSIKMKADEHPTLLLNEGEDKVHEESGQGSEE